MWLNLVIMGNLEKIVKFGKNCEIWWKWEIWKKNVKFGKNCDFWDQNVKFGRKCEIWTKVWNLNKKVKFWGKCEIWTINVKFGQNSEGCNIGEFLQMNKNRRLYHLRAVQNLEVICSCWRLYRAVGRGNVLTRVGKELPGQLKMIKMIKIPSEMEVAPQ